MPSNSFVARLQFEEVSGNQAQDTSPNGSNNLGRLRNGATFNSSGGQFGGAVALDGVNDYIAISDSSDINLGIHPKRTVSVWFKSDDPDSDGKQVLYEEGGQGRGLNIYLDQGQLYVGGWNRGESNWRGTYLSTGAVTAERWHHVALVLDAEPGVETVQSGALSGYLDGEPFGQGAGSQLWEHVDNMGLGAVNQGTQFHDGQASGTGSSSLGGSLDEFRVYNRALSETEIAQLAEAGTPSSSPALSIGTNLNAIDYFSTELPFTNAFYSSRPWLTQADGIFNSKEYDQLDLDENGWVKSLPAPEDPPEYTFVGTQMYRNISGRYPGGKYIVLYDGEGTIDYSFDAEKDEAASSPGRDVIDVTPTNAGIYLQIKETDPDQTGDYIRNIRVVPEEYEDTYTTEIFNPVFIEKVEPFDAFRFMDWMETNGSDQQEWKDRPTLDTATFADIGVPIEAMVELANQTQTDPWFNIPHKATDEYVENFAQYVNDNLDPNLDIYIEYSNEVWNPGKSQSQWVLEQAQQEWPDSELDDFTLKTDYYSKRTTEVVGIWESVFGSAEEERIIGVMGAQTVFPYYVERALEYAWSSEDLTNEEYGIDAIAMNAYFGRYLTIPENEQEVQGWTTDEDGGFGKLFEEITEGGVLSNGPEGGALQEVYNDIQLYADIAEQENLDLLAYEGGQALRGVRGVERNPVLAEFYIEANRDPRMGEVYEEFITEWFELGGDLFAHYTDVEQPDKFGSFGALEYVGQDGSPKYDALVGLLDPTTDASLVV